MIQTEPRRFPVHFSYWTRLSARGPRRHTALASVLVALLAVGLQAGCSSGEPAPEPVSPEEPTPGVTVPAEGTGRPRPPVPTTVVPLEPQGEVVLADGFTFRWQAPEGAEVATWNLRVFTRSLQLIWSASDLTVTELAAPRDLLLKMEPGTSYTWRVAGRLAEGGRIRSPDARIAAR